MVIAAAGSFLLGRYVADFDFPLSLFCSKAALETLHSDESIAARPISFLFIYIVSVKLISSLVDLVSQVDDCSEVNHPRLSMILSTFRSQESAAVDS